MQLALTHETQQVRRYDPRATFEPVKVIGNSDQRGCDDWYLKVGEEKCYCYAASSLLKMHVVWKSAQGCLTRLGTDIVVAQSGTALHGCCYRSPCRVSDESPPTCHRDDLPDSTPPVPC